MMKKILNWLGKEYLWIAASWLCSSLRLRIHNAESFEEHRKGEKPYVVAFWHGSMVVGWFLHRPVHGKKVAALVSRSEDGEILSATLEHWGYTLIRGSSHAGGKEAMQRMTEALSNGNSLCVTPDGPTGPRHQMKMGAVRAAQQSQVPLFLSGIAVGRKKKLHSWDEFEIPLPFSSVDVWYSDPIVVPQDLQGALLDEFLSRSQSQLEGLCAKAEQELLNE
jgi:lysophospholipid acyltransferase (LPLAT)-like uncharacterized protein